MFVRLVGSLGEVTADAIDWLGGAVHWIGALLDPVGAILADLWPAVVAAIATVAVIRSIRYLLLLWRGRTPRVQISNFAWAMSEDASREATWVTSLFREQLAALRLDALDPLPERAPGAPLVEIVEGVGQGVGKDIGTALGRLFRAAWPDSAYEVWGTLRPRQEGGDRISVQLIERRRGNRTLLNVALEEASWEDGAREAAMAVAGALYPRVRKRDRGPWTLWTRAVPRSLMGHYHAARRYEEEDRLEHALAGYHAALDEDPLNPNLRLKIAMLQERLELYLDAWVTYEAIVSEPNRRAWRGPDRRVYLLALYRLAVMLSNGEVAKQWVKECALPPDRGNLRHRERHQRREELLRSLACDPLFQPRNRLRPSQLELPKAFSRTVSSLLVYARAKYLFSILRTVDAETNAPQDALATFRRTEEGKEAERRVEAVLQILALRNLERLEGAQRWWHRRRPEFLRSAIRISKVLVRTRIVASLEREVERRYRNGDQPGREAWVGELREAHRALTRRWPYPAPPLRSHARRLRPGRLLRTLRRRESTWQLYYNAACAAASLLREDSAFHGYELELEEAEEDRAGVESRRALPRGIDGPEIVRTATALLDEYATRAGSDRVAAQADWVAIDDSDLEGLRHEPEFKLWAGHHLPRDLPTTKLSRKTDVKRFTVRVMRDGARVFSSAWRERASRPWAPASEIAEWWSVETTVWTALANASREHLSWQERLTWITTLQDWLRAGENGQEVDFSHEARGTAVADSMTEGLFDRLADLAGARQGNGGPPPPTDGPSVLPWVQERSRHVLGAHEVGEERADQTGTLRSSIEREEALRAARIWSRLADLLELELDGPSESGSEAALGERMEAIRSQLPQQG